VLAGRALGSDGPFRRARGIKVPAWSRIGACGNDSGLSVSGFILLVGWVTCLFLQPDAAWVGAAWSASPRWLWQIDVIVLARRLILWFL